MSTTNYMSMKDEELLKLIDEYGLEKEDYLNEKGGVVRKKINNVLKAIDLATGKAL